MAATMRPGTDRGAQAAAVLRNSQRALPGR
jgi:hypothetical protein